MFSSIQVPHKSSALSVAGNSGLSMEKLAYSNMYGTAQILSVVSGQRRASVLYAVCTEGSEMLAIFIALSCMLHFLLSNAW